MGRIHTGDWCMKCEMEGEAPRKGVIRVVYGQYEGYVCLQCAKRIEEEESMTYVLDED